MNRSIIFSNTALNIYKLKKLEKIFDNNENITNLDIYSTRNIKENKIKVRDSQTFKSMKDLISYIDEKNIEILETLEINIRYKNFNNATLKYDNFDHRWELSYFEQDRDIDSLIYNLEPLMRNNPLKFYRKHRFILSFTIVWFSLIFVLENASEGLSLWIPILICIILALDSFCAKNVPFREYRFITRNKDEIILAIISYFTGVVTPYVINWIIGKI